METPEKILTDFTNWFDKNYKRAKGGYRHAGDFYNNHKPERIQAIKDFYLKHIYKPC